MSQYNTGTTTWVNGSPSVSGEGTSWLTYASVGDLIKKRGEDAFYFVGAVTTDTTLSITAPYAGTSGSGELYTLCRDFTDNYSAPEIWPGDKDWALHVTYALRIFDAAIAAISGEDYSIVDHGSTTPVTLTSADYNKIHLFYPSGGTQVVNFPEPSAEYVGKWLGY